MGNDTTLQKAIDVYTKVQDPSRNKHYVDMKEGEKDDTDYSAVKTISNILKHRHSVNSKLQYLSRTLKERGEKHDASKLEPPEIDWLIAMDKEPIYPYGSPEYFEKMRRWEKFFKHHYGNNRHHPSHFEHGIEGMNLIDLCEYCCDIISYYDEMHPDQAFASLEAQRERFGMDEQLTCILKNTLLEYFTWFGDFKPPAYEETVN